MITFQNFEEQKDSSVTAICGSCDWSGPSSTAKHLANDPICPICNAADLQLVEEGDETGRDL
jgi:hypothetical protein